MDDAVRLLARDAPRERAGRLTKRAVIVVTDGFPVGDTVAPRTVVERANAAGVSVYTVTMPSFSLLNGGTPVPTILDVSRLAELTGGRNVYATGGSYDELFRSLAEEVTSSASYANFRDGVGNDQFRLREAFMQGGNIFKSQPGAKFWAGQRYYRRYQSHINDFYISDMSGYGAGVEDLNVRAGKVSVAFIAGARPDITTEAGNYAKSNVDVRLYDVNVPGGKLAAWFNFARAKGGTTQGGAVIPTANGFAFGIAHQRLEWHGGYNWFSVQYGEGAASNFSTALDDPTPFLKQSKRLRIAEHLLLQPNDKFAIAPVFVYQRTHSGNPREGWNRWVSFGARPQYFFTEHLSLAFEAGFDHTRSGHGQYDGWLRKFTIAPQIGAGRKFFSRPALRLFLTYADWSDGLRGFVGGVPFRDRTSGFTYGVQTETWW